METRKSNCLGYRWSFPAQRPALNLPTKDAVLIHVHIAKAPGSKSAGGEGGRSTCSIYNRLVSTHVKDVYPSTYHINPPSSSPPLLSPPSLLLPSPPLPLQYPNLTPNTVLHPHQSPTSSYYSSPPSTNCKSEIRSLPSWKVVRESQVSEWVSEWIIDK